jgi:predicted NBD/HSP70 family sugar kinase
VLNLIKSAGPISRKEIASRSGLSPATVTNLTAELIADGLVHEMGAGEATRGRRPVLLRLNSRAGFVVGVKVMGESVAAVVTDLDAHVLEYQARPLGTLGGEGGESLAESDHAMVTDPDVVLRRVAEIVDSAIAAAGIDRSQIFGVGLGLAGLIDGQAGVCRYSPVFGWRDVDLAEPLGSLLGLDVILENDVNTLTIAEQWFGHGHGHDHFCVVTVGAGVGVGLVVNGQFYRGVGGGAGELGHVVVSPDGPACGCGKRGCLEALASDGAVVREAQSLVDAGRETLLAQAEDLTIEDIVRAADEGDQLAQELLAAAGRWLGIGVATVVNLLNPALVIVGGEGVAAGEWRLASMRAAFREHAFEGLADQAELVIEPAGDETWARGAACVVLGELFKSPLHRGHRVAFPGAKNHGLIHSTANR